MKHDIDIDKQTKEELGQVELSVLTNVSLGDLIRAGSKNTEKAVGWGDGTITACALTAAKIAAKDLGYNI